MTRTAQHPDRISLRLSPQAKRKLERPAAYSDNTLTDFVVDVALQKGRRDRAGVRGYQPQCRGMGTFPSAAVASAETK